MLEIVIKGATGVGKSLYANSLVERAIAGSLQVKISDHELFTRKSNFEKMLEKVKISHKQNDVDVSIIVINDEKDSLRVDFGGRVPFNIAKIIFPV